MKLFYINRFGEIKGQDVRPDNDASVVDIIEPNLIVALKDAGQFVNRPQLKLNDFEEFFFNNVSADLKGFAQKSVFNPIEIKTVAPLYDWYKNSEHKDQVLNMLFYAATTDYPDRWVFKELKDVIFYNPVGKYAVLRRDGALYGSGGEIDASFEYLNIIIPVAAHNMTGIMESFNTIPKEHHNNILVNVPDFLKWYLISEVEQKYNNCHHTMEAALQHYDYGFASPIVDSISEVGATYYTQDTQGNTLRAKQDAIITCSVYSSLDVLEEQVVINWEFGMYPGNTAQFRLTNFNAAGDYIILQIETDNGKSISRLNFNDIPNGGENKAYDTQITSPE